MVQLLDIDCEHRRRLFRRILLEDTDFDPTLRSLRLDLDRVMALAEGDERDAQLVINAAHEAFDRRSTKMEWSAPAGEAPVLWEPSLAAAVEQVDRAWVRSLRRA